MLFYTLVCFTLRSYKWHTHSVNWMRIFETLSYTGYSITWNDFWTFDGFGHFHYHIDLWFDLDNNLCLTLTLSQSTWLFPRLQDSHIVTPQWDSQHFLLSQWELIRLFYIYFTLLTFSPSYCTTEQSHNHCILNYNGKQEMELWENFWGKKYFRNKYLWLHF